MLISTPGSTIAGFEHRSSMIFMEEI